MSRALWRRALFACAALLLLNVWLASAAPVPVRRDLQATLFERQERSDTYQSLQRRGKGKAKASSAPHGHGQNNANAGGSHAGQHDHRGPAHTPDLKRVDLTHGRQHHAGGISTHTFTSPGRMSQASSAQQKMLSHENPHFGTMMRELAKHAETASDLGGTIWSYEKGKLATQKAKHAAGIRLDNQGKIGQGQRLNLQVQQNGAKTGLYSSIAHVQVYQGSQHNEHDLMNALQYSMEKKVTVHFPHPQWTGPPQRRSVSQASHLELCVECWEDDEEVADYEEAEES